MTTAPADQSAPDVAGPVAWAMRMLTQHGQAGESIVTWDRRMSKAWAKLPDCESFPLYSAATIERLSAERDEARDHARRMARGAMDSEGRALAAERELAEARLDAALGNVLMRFIDRLTDPTPEDTLEKIVRELDAAAMPIINAAHDAARAANEKGKK